MKSMSASKRNIFLSLIFIGAAYFLTAFYNAGFLSWAAEISLFLPTRLFFINTMQTAGGLLSYLGLFLNQFFYYPWLGSTLFIALQGVVIWLTVKTFKIPENYFPLAFLPSILLLTSLSEVGYLLYVLKSPGYLFANTLGIIAVLASLSGYQKIKSTPIKPVAIALFVALTYPLFGFYTLFTVLLVIVTEVKQLTNSRGLRLKSAMATILIGLLFSIVIPYLCYTYLYSGMQWHWTYLAGLPKFYLKLEFRLWLPFIVLFVILLLFSVFKDLKVLKALSLILFAIFIIGSYFYADRDTNFRTELKMNKAIEANDWEEVVRLGKQQKTAPTRLIIMDYNLALFKLGRAGDEMFAVNQGSVVAQTNRPDMIMMHLGAKPVYFQYGKVNYCYRWCMEDMVEYGMTVQGLKYMVKCAVGMGDFALAQKYNNVLKKTLFHKAWANEYQQYIDTPKSFLEIPEIKAIKPLLAYENLLDGDGGLLELYVLNSFAFMQGGPPDIVELSIQCNLVLKNIERFWPRYFLYARTHDRIPVHYQEAAILYAYLENRDASKLKTDAGVIERFDRLLAMSKLYEDKPDEFNAKMFKPQFGNTFWYYYFFVKDIKTN
jgi:hypothetical protein